MKNLLSETPLDPDKKNKMNIDISGREAGEKILYTDPHFSEVGLFFFCADPSFPSAISPERGGL